MCPPGRRTAGGWRLSAIRIWNRGLCPENGTLALGRFLSKERRDACTLHAFREVEVAQVSNLLCRRLPVGKAYELPSACGLEIRDTADWKSALWLPHPSPR